MDDSFVELPLLLGHAPSNVNAASLMYNLQCVFFLYAVAATAAACVSTLTSEVAMPLADLSAQAWT